MSDLGNKKIIAANIRKYMEKNNVTRADLVKALDVPYTTVRDWTKGNTYPRIDKIEMMANYFGVSKADLVEADISYEYREGFLPVYGSVCAGNGVYADDNIEDWIETGARKYLSNTHFALRIKGDSMEPELHTNDIVIVKKQDVAENNEIVIALVNGDEGVCKQLKKYEGGMALVSLNPNYPPRYFSEEEVTGIPVQIIGKVVETRRTYE